MAEIKGRCNSFSFFCSGYSAPGLKPDLRHVGEPLQDGVNAVKVVRHRGVCDAVVVHDLHAAQLVVGRVHLATENLKTKADGKED